MKESIEDISLEEFLQLDIIKDINPGLIASFKYETTQDPELLSEKSVENWLECLRFQSNKRYK